MIVFSEVQWQQQRIFVHLNVSEEEEFSQSEAALALINQSNDWLIKYDRV